MDAVDLDFLGHFQMLQFVAEKSQGEESWERTFVCYQRISGIISSLLQKAEQKGNISEEESIKIVQEQYTPRVSESLNRNLNTCVSSIFSEVGVSPQFKFSCPPGKPNTEKWKSYMPSKQTNPPETSLTQNVKVDRPIDRPDPRAPHSFQHSQHNSNPVTSHQPPPIQPPPQNYSQSPFTQTNYSQSPFADNNYSQSPFAQTGPPRQPTNTWNAPPSFQKPVPPPVYSPPPDPYDYPPAIPELPKVSCSKELSHINYGTAEKKEEVEETKSPFITAKDKLVPLSLCSPQVKDQAKTGGNYKATKTSKKAVGKRKFVTPFKRDEEDEDSSPTTKRQTKGSPKEMTFAQQLMQDERLKGCEEHMVELICNEILDRNSPVEWEDIAGLEFAKQTVKEIIIFPLLRPDIFTGIRAPPRGMLLFGPPGTGKTMIGKAIASKSKSTFFSISASSLTSKWIGEGEKMVRILFAVARCCQPSVIFIDEIDSLLTQRSDSENEASRRIKTEFLVQFDGARTDGTTERILLIGATNRPQELDEAARRRLVKRLYIPLPDLVARQTLIKHLIDKDDNNHSLTEEDILTVARKCEGADVTSLVTEAAYIPVRDMQEDIINVELGAVRPMSLKDFEIALHNVRPSVSQNDLKQYEEWNATFGSFHPGKRSEI